MHNPRLKCMPETPPLWQRRRRARAMGEQTIVTYRDVREGRTVDEVEVLLVMQVVGPCKPLRLILLGHKSLQTRGSKEVLPSSS